MAASEFSVRVHDEGEGTLWAEVIELPGCFATGVTEDDLLEALREAIAMHVDHPITEATWSNPTDRVQEQRLLVAR